MEEMVTFELPGHGEAVALRAQLAASRLCLVDYDDGTWQVRAGVAPEAEDFAVLLRTVEAWVERMELRRIGFRTDGRSYALVAGSLGARVAA